MTLGTNGRSLLSVARVGPCIRPHSESPDIGLRLLQHILLMYRYCLLIGPDNPWLVVRESVTWGHLSAVFVQSNISILPLSPLDARLITINQSAGRSGDYGQRIE